MKILAFIGTRPEAIKMVPLIKKMREIAPNVNLKVVSTGQHREMIAQVTNLFKITPDIDLAVMTKNQSLSQLTSDLFHKIDDVILAEKPDWVIAQGDTTSVFVASVVSFYHKVKFAHLEAGLRTHNIFSPFPEEFNRRVAGIIADIHFAPTLDCAETLKQEGVPENKILVTGNTVIDALMEIENQEVALEFQMPDHKKIILVTAHRRESFDKMSDMFQALLELAKEFPEIHIIYPVHLNPIVHNKAMNLLSGVDNIQLVSPLDYQSFVFLMKRSSLILTDSGGIQEEAPFFGVPVLIMRDTTERQEGVKAGVAKLIGTKKENIIQAFRECQKTGFKKHSILNPYGDGTASQRITNFFLKA